MTEAVVTAVDVVFRYDGHQAVARSSFEIPQGAITAVIGPNGSGKSTLLNGIAGLVRPAAGTIRVAAHQSRIAYVLQATKVNETLPVTVREVVTMGRYSELGGFGRVSAAGRAAVDQAMERMGVADFAGRHLSELSGGQRQRVFVAQGLAQDHDVLLLDEPLTGLDLPSARAIDEVIHDEPRLGCTVIVTTHDLAEARAMDHVVLLAGKVVAAGPPDDVLTAEYLAAAYGQSLLHADGEELFIDDPAHVPVPGRHLHRERGGPGDGGEVPPP